MAEDKKSKRTPPKREKPPSTDNEKTFVDFDIRQLDKDFEDTAIVKVPLDEDSDFHDFRDEERTGKIPVKELEKEEAESFAAEAEIPPESISEKYGGPKTVKEFSMPFVVLLSLLAVFQIESLVELFHQGVGWVWVLLTSTVLTFITLVGVFKRRVDSLIGFLWGLVFCTAAITYAGINFFNSDPQTLHFFKISLRDLLPFHFLFLLGIVLYLIFRVRLESALPKILLSISALLMLVAVGISLLSGISLEGMLLGPDWATSWPIYVRPVVVALIFAFPIAAMAIAIPLTSRLTRQRFSSMMIPLLLITVMGALISAQMLARRGIVFPLFSKSQSAFYEIYSTQPQSKGNLNVSKLMIKNQEGRGWVGDTKKIPEIKKYEVNGSKIKVIHSRLGEERYVGLFLLTPRLEEKNFKTALEMSIQRLRNNLSETEHLSLFTDFSSGIQGFKKFQGIKHFMVVLDSAQDPLLLQKANYENEARKVGATVSFIFLSEGPPSLSLSLMSAASEALGDFELISPVQQLSVQQPSAAENGQDEKLTVAPIQKIQFIKPFDKDSVSGVINVLLTDGGEKPNKATEAVELLADGVKVGQATSRPFVIPWDTSSLSPGLHSLQANQTFSDGTTDSTQIQVNVDPRAPKIAILHPSSGEYLPNVSEIEVQVGGGLFEQIQKVDFLVNGEWVGEALQPPYRFLWVNDSFPNREYFIQAKATLNSQETVSDAVQVQLGFGDLIVQADESLSPSGKLFPQVIEMAIDGSLSMNQTQQDWIKWELVRLELTKIREFIPAETKLGIRVFGTQSMEQQDNCEDVKKVKNLDKEILPLKAQGKSCLAFLLDSYFREVKKLKGAKTGILILNDWDTCGGDPLEVANKFSKSPDKFRVHILYFGDIPATQESLIKNLADRLGGKGVKINRPVDLEKGLKEAIQIQAILFDYKNNAIFQAPLDATSHRVRSGEYKLVVDSYPPVTKERFVISSGSQRTVFLKSSDGQFKLEEK